MKEIERRYLLKRHPGKQHVTQTYGITQFWMPGEVIQLRFRQRVPIKPEGLVEYFQTIKFGKGVERDEYEESIVEDYYKTMYSAGLKHDVPKLTKLRDVIPYNKYVWEIDTFVNDNGYLAEIELPARDSFVVMPADLQEVIVREVTDDKRYTNYNIAKYGFPQE